MPSNFRVLNFADLQRTVREHDHKYERIIATFEITDACHDAVCEVHAGNET